MLFFKIKQRLHVLAKYLQQAMAKSLLHSEHQLIAIGAIGFLGFPLYYFVWTYVFPQPYENLPLRMVGGLLCGGLMVVTYWPKSLIKYLPAYWYITILYTLGFFFSFMLFKSEGTVISAMVMLVAVFLMILLVDWVSLLILSTSGLILAWFAYYVSTPNPIFPAINFQYLTIYTFTIIAGSVFNYKTALLHLQRLEGMASLSGNVAHELRTPLLGLKSGVVGLRRYLPILIDVYNLSREQGLDVPKVRALHFNNLLPALERMESEITFANTIIDMLLMNVGKQVIDPGTFQPCSIIKSVNTALKRYPFDSAEQESKIHWSPQDDFTFIGSQLFMEHILFNLLKNALHFIVKAERGEIFIELGADNRWNYLRFKDTGQGIPEQVLPHIFNRFYTTTLTGTGIGLSFCKMVMTSFGGDIVCNSEEGKFTEFTLSFPKTESKSKAD